MAKLKLDIPEGQVAFLRRKVTDIKRMVPPGEEGKVTLDALLQGLVSHWQALDAGAKHPGQDLG